MLQSTLRIDALFEHFKQSANKLSQICQPKSYNSFLIYCRELAPDTVSLTGDRAQGDDSKHDSHYTLHRPDSIRKTMDGLFKYIGIRAWFARALSWLGHLETVRLWARA